MKSVSVVLPTYNEANNIVRMLQALTRVGQENGFDLKIHVVDDDSPDGTAEYVRRAAQDNKNIYLIKGKKAGLGSAYIRGFKEVLKNHKPEVIIMMDCDFSHDPFFIPRLVDCVSKGNDYVIGSRYVEGGAIPGTWPLLRVLNSKVANFVASFLGGISPSIKDKSSGFRAIKVETLRSIDYENVNTHGYGFLMHLLHLFLQNNYSVKEIPIVFKDRTLGDSKMRIQDILGFIKCAYGLSPGSPAKRAVKFASVGFIGIIVNLSVLFLFKNLTDLPLAVSSVVAVELSIVSNFILNSVFTFKDRMPGERKKAGLAKKAVRYNGVSVTTAVLTVALFVLLNSVLRIHYLVAQFTAICLSFAVNFWVSSKFVWAEENAID